MKKKTVKLLKKAGITVAVLAFWLTVWHIAAVCVNKEILVVTPLTVGRVLINEMQTAAFWRSVGASLLRIFSGFVCGVFTGTLTASLSFINAPAGHILRPLLTVIKATPVASFIVLALVWIQTDNVPVFISFLMVTPIVHTNVLQGLKSAPQSMNEVCKLYRFSKLKTLRHLYIPSVKPYFAAALNTAMGLAWKAGIAAEVLCRPEFSIGGAIWRAKITIETADVFAWTVVVIVMSLVIEKLLAIALRRFIKGEIADED